MKYSGPFVIVCVISWLLSYPRVSLLYLGIDTGESTVMLLARNAVEVTR
jgi:hypothetical protein